MSSFTYRPQPLAYCPGPTDQDHSHESEGCEDRAGESAVLSSTPGGSASVSSTLARPGLTPSFEGYTSEDGKQPSETSRVNNPVSTDGTAADGRKSIRARSSADNSNSWISAKKLKTTSKFSNALGTTETVAHVVRDASAALVASEAFAAPMVACGSLTFPCVETSPAEISAVAFIVEATVGAPGVGASGLEASVEKASPACIKDAVIALTHADEGSHGRDDAKSVPRFESDSEHVAHQPAAPAPQELCDTAHQMVAEFESAMQCVVAIEIAKQLDSSELQKLTAPGMEVPQDSQQLRKVLKVLGPHLPPFPLPHGGYHRTIHITPELTHRICTIYTACCRFETVEGLESVTRALESDTRVIVAVGDCLMRDRADRVLENEAYITGFHVIDASDNLSLATFVDHVAQVRLNATDPHLNINSSAPNGFGIVAFVPLGRLSEAGMEKLMTDLLHFAHIRNRQLNISCLLKGLVVRPFRLHTYGASILQLEIVHTDELPINVKFKRISFMERRSLHSHHQPTGRWVKGALHPLHLVVSPDAHVAPFVSPRPTKVSDFNPPAPHMVNIHPDAIGALIRYVLTHPDVNRSYRQHCALLLSDSHHNLETELAFLGDMLYPLTTASANDSLDFHESDVAHVLEILRAHHSLSAETLLVYDRDNVDIEDIFQRIERCLQSPHSAVFAIAHMNHPPSFPLHVVVVSPSNDETDKCPFSVRSCRIWSRTSTSASRWREIHAVPLFARRLSVPLFRGCSHNAKPHVCEPSYWTPQCFRGAEEFTSPGAVVCPSCRAVCYCSMRCNKQEKPELTGTHAAMLEAQHSLSKKRKRQNEDQSSDDRTAGVEVAAVYCEDAHHVNVPGLHVVKRTASLQLHEQQQRQQAAAKMTDASVPVQSAPTASTLSAPVRSPAAPHSNSFMGCTYPGQLEQDDDDVLSDDSACAADEN